MCRQLLIIVAGVFAAGCLANPIESLESPEPLDLQLESHIDGSVFYEGEPIYTTFELANGGTDTAYIPPWYLGDDWLVATLTRRDGQPVPKQGWFVDFVWGPGYRGDPLAPGDTRFATTALQVYWGESSTLRDLLFLRHLRVGQYQLDASLRADLNPPPGQRSRYLTANPIVGAYYFVAATFGRADPSLSGELGESLAGRVALAIETHMVQSVTR